MIPTTTHSSSASPASPAHQGFRPRLVAPLVASAVLNPINSTMIAVALVPIGRTFGSGPEQTAWLVSALYLATAIGQPVVGLFVDRFGARRVLLTGAATVAVAGLAGMFEISVGWLIGVRVILGIGTCAGFPAAMAVLRRHAEATGQGVPARVLSVLAMSAQTIMVIGPTLGGALIGVFGWPAVFAVNLPLAAVAMGLALAWVPRDAPANQPATGGRESWHIDVAGIVLFALGLLALLCFLMEPALANTWFLLAALACAVVFTRVELRVSRPFLDLRMLAANRAILRTYLRQALSFLIIYSVMFGYVQWLESTRGFSESAAGLMLLPMSLVAVGAAAASGRDSGILGRLVLTALALTGGSALLLTTGQGTPVLVLVAVTALFGIGQGLTGVTNQMTLYREAPAGQMGTASGLFRTAQYLGAIGASTLIALCYGPHASSAGLHRLSWTLVAVGLLLLTVTVLDRGLRRHRPAGDPAGDTEVAKDPAVAHHGQRDSQRAEA